MKNQLDAHHSLALYAVAFFLIIIGLFLSEYNPPVNKIASNQSPSIQNDYNLSSKDIHLLDSAPYKLRNFESDDNFMTSSVKPNESKKYPKTLNLKDNELQNIRCTQIINSENRTSDPAMLKIVKNITKNGETIRQATFCQVEKSQSLIYYSLRNNEGLKQKKSGIYFDTVNEDLTTTTQVNYINEYAGYMFSCGNTLQYTTENQLYVSCGGGDIVQSQSLNIVDFNSGKITSIYYCLDKSPEENSKAPYITCRVPSEDKESLFF